MHTAHVQCVCGLVEKGKQEDRSGEKRGRKKGAR